MTDDKNRKKNIVKQLLNEDLKTDDETELIEMLFDEPLAIDTDKLEDEKRNFGDKLADAVTKTAGSWLFIISFVLFLFFWMFLNEYLDGIDAYPFILLNLVLSCIAALQAPIIMMSQNREAKKDSLRSKNDYRIDLKSELILEVLHEQMVQITKNQEKILQILSKNGIKFNNIKKGKMKN